MAMIPLDPIPVDQPLIQGDPTKPRVERTDLMDERWFRWMSAFITRVLANPNRVASESRSNQNAALSITLFSPQQPGLYLILWYLRVTIPDGASSSATVTVGWKDTGTSLTKTFPAITGNTSTTNDSGIAFVNADAAGLSLSVAYSSGTPNQMRYTVTGTVVQVA